MMVTGVNSLGQLWAPKKSRLYVGRDVLARESASPQKAVPWEKGLNDDVASISKEALAKYQTSRADNAGMSHSVKLGDGRTVNFNFMGDDPKSGGKIIDVYVPGETEARRFTISEDTRISFNEKGEPQVTSGSPASSGGVLRATGKDEILINFSSAKVEAGENSTVINFAGAGGEFVSGTNTTYLGVYDGAKFKDGTGNLTFAGVFDNSEINVGKGRGAFSGTFTKSLINGGALNDSFNGVFNETQAFGNDGNDSFGGLFMAGSSIDAGAGNDVINGRFINSDIAAGDGNDTIGNFRLDGKPAQEFQFVNSNIDTGAGDNRIRAAALNSVIDFGTGDNRAYGIFQGSTLNNTEGNAKITALLSNRTDYTTGAGETDMTLATAVHSEVTTGEGKSTVNLGVGENQHYSETIDGEHRSLEHLVWQYSKRDDYAFGEVLGNQVNMDKGDATLNVSTGQNSYSVHARNEEAPTGRIDPAAGLPETELQRRVDVVENVAADLSSATRAVNVKLSTDLMLEFQTEDHNIMSVGRRAATGYRTYAYNLGKAQ